MNIIEIECKICQKIYHKPETFVCHFNKMHGANMSLAEYCRTFFVHAESKCEFCGNDAQFISFTKGFKPTCADANCVQLRHDIVFEHAKVVRAETKLKRYGSATYCNSDKAKQTNLEKYGSISYTGTSEYKERVKESCIEKYGTDHFTQSDEFKERMRQQHLAKYGVDHPWKDPEVLEKRKKTVIDTYGGYTFASKELMEKVKKTNLEKYGSESHANNPEIREKTKNTNLEKYGHVVPMQSKRLLLEKYGEGVKCSQDIPGVVEKQKINRLASVREKYGVENVSQLEWVQKIIRNTNLQKYGVETFLSSKDVHDRIRRTNFERYGVENQMHREEIFQKVFQTNHRKKYKHTKYYTKFGDSISYQSNLELSFINACEDSGNRILNGDVISYEFEGKNRQYYVDFKIFYDDKWQLIEIKAPHQWYYDDLESGKLDAKTSAVIQYSIEHDYHPFKLLMSGEGI